MIKKRRLLALLATVIVVLGVVFYLNSLTKTSQATLPVSTEEPFEQTMELKSTEEPENSSTVPVQTQIHVETQVPNSPAPSTYPTEEPTEKPLSCSLIVSCDDILKHMDKLTEEKEELIPQDGLIYSKQFVEFEKGESVFDILYREMRNNKIHMEFVNTPMYNSAYIEGIANIYEFDCGDSSGWTYEVNGKSPTYGCSQYIIQAGDKIEFVYKCSLYGN